MDMLGSTLKATHAKAKGSLKEKGKRAKRKVKKTARNSLLVMMNEKLMESSYNKKPNCRTREAWTAEKTEWCCENQNLGCPARKLCVFILFLN